MNVNKLGIAIPTYNRERYLLDLVATIPDDVNIFISDNGGKSTKNEDFKKNRFKISLCDDLPMFDNWNNSLQIADCDYIAITSDDDLYLPGAFDIVRKCIDLENADVYIFGHNYIDQDENIIGTYSYGCHRCFEPPEGFQVYKYGVDARMPSIFFRKKFLDEIGYFDCSLFEFTAADSELIQRAMLKGRVAFFPEVISCYRVWKGSFTDKKISTHEWLEQVEKWTQKISKIGSEKAAFFTKKFADNYSDEIYARNLYAGLSNLLKRREYKGALEFKAAARWPSHALARTKLRILLLLLKAKLKSYAS